MTSFIKETEQKLKKTVFFIEATSCEQFYLWKEYHEKIDWEEDNMGFWEQIGCIGGDIEKPVCVSFTFAKIYGKIICFYDVTSRYSDSVMVENWIEENYPVKWDNGSRKAMTDAINFHHAINCCKNG